MIHIETNRLILRNVSPKDAAIMHDYRNSEICARYQRGQTKDYEDICELIERRQNDEISEESPFLIAVADRRTDNLIGEIVVMPGEGTISLGYTFHYAHHRKGYAFEALSIVINLLHERYPTWEFICFTHPENLPSMALLKKLGYTDIGYLPTKDSHVFGRWITPETQAEIAQIQQASRNCPF